MEENPVKPPQPTFPPLEIPEGIEAIYINIVRIAHSPSELVFDFAHLLPGTAPAQVRSRIVMSPLAAKLFFRALGENLSRYETAFGEIRVPGSKSLADFLFKPPTPDEPPQE